MSVNLHNSVLTSYITDRKPNFYGGRQEEYLEFAERAIESGVSLIANEIEKGTDPVEIYHTLVKTLQIARHEIALQHQPEKAHYFGIRRDDPEAIHREYVPAVTGLYGQYEEYNKKYLNQLIEILHRIPHDLRTFSKKSIRGDETVLGKRYSYQIELLDQAELDRLKYQQPPSPSDLVEALGISLEAFPEIFHTLDLMNRLKSQRKDLYDRVTMHSILDEINEKFPSPSMRGMVEEEKVVQFERKNIYVLTTLRLETEPEKMVCIGRHLTWMYQDYVNDPVDRMRDHSFDYVIHQDLFLIERTQNFCSQIFRDILTWNRSESLETLKDRMALLRFVYGNSMPCSRGDGGVGDWLELILYRYLGFSKTRHAKDKLPCFEMLSTIKLSDYLRNYPETIIVE